MSTYIVGHKSPDTDSVISAIALAALLGEGNVPARTDDLNKETEYILTRFGLETPKTLPESAASIIMVDHNSPEEASEWVTPEKIRAIYDHHRLGGGFTASPVPVRIETIGSTSSLVAKMYREQRAELAKNLAGALICGILSDTLKFTSPTTTDEDKEIVEWLNTIASIDLENTAQAMFMAKSDVGGLSAADLLTADYKVFDMSGQKVGVGVWETVLPDAVMSRSEEIMEALKAEKEKSGLDYIFFAVVDILKQVAYFFMCSEKETEVAESVFNASAKKGIVTAEGVVSRKKQIIPPLEKYFS